MHPFLFPLQVKERVLAPNGQVVETNETTLARAIETADDLGLKCGDAITLMLRRHRDPQTGMRHEVWKDAQIIVLYASGSKTYARLLCTTQEGFVTRVVRFTGKEDGLVDLKTNGRMPWKRKVKALPFPSESSAYTRALRPEETGSLTDRSNRAMRVCRSVRRRGLRCRRKGPMARVPSRPQCRLP